MVQCQIFLIQTLVNVTVEDPGLPVLLHRNEMYMCLFEDSKGRFNITVPAVEVEPLTRYSCNIINQLREYSELNIGTIVIIGYSGTPNNGHSK